MSSMVATFSETTPSRAVSVMFMILALISYFFCKEGGKCEEDVGQSPLLWYAQKRGGGQKRGKRVRAPFFSPRVHMHQRQGKRTCWSFSSSSMTVACVAATGNKREVS